MSDKALAKSEETLFVLIVQKFREALKCKWTWIHRTRPSKKLLMP